MPGSRVVDGIVLIRLEKTVRICRQAWGKSQLHWKAVMLAVLCCTQWAEILPESEADHPNYHGSATDGSIDKDSILVDSVVSVSTLRSDRLSRSV